MILDPMLTPCDPLRHASHEQVVGNLTLHRAGRCCCCCMSGREASLLFDFCYESCPSDLGTTCVNGALHTDASPAANEPISLAHPAVPVLTTRGAFTRSQLKADRERYLACVNVLSGDRAPADVDLVGRQAQES